IICQLRALYRASVYGTLKIMFPMIATMEELEEALKIAAQVRTSLKNEGYKINEDVPVGMMMEVPSAVLAADAFAEKVAFFSIGSNDLIQYTMAMDRGNERVAYLYQPFNPAILRLLKMVIDAGKKRDISVSVCGEIAADPLSAIVLLGMGIDELSMSSQSISVIKKVIRNVLYTEAKETVAEIMDMDNGTKIYNYLRTKYNDRFGIYL
ncbi:MAG: phosphoenolpyruvate--protein phosphotransferase, partial [Spirochaetia bacterium]|nr:phosphoenolpyruvate--protein phosphotransferase [Spirochaetia bacterium]